MLVLAALAASAATGAAHAAKRLHAVFTVSARGAYSMSWSETKSIDCSPSPASNYDLHEAETINYHSGRPVRADLYATSIYVLNEHRRFPWLIMEGTYRGGAVTTDPHGHGAYTGFRIDTSGRFTRSVSGSFEDCGQPVTTASSKGCGAVNVHYYALTLYWDPSTGNMDYSVALDYSRQSMVPPGGPAYLRDPFGGRCTLADLNSEESPAELLVSLNGSLACPLPHAFVTVPVGRTVTCKEIQFPLIEGGSLEGEVQKQTLTLVFHRVG